MSSNEHVSIRLPVHLFTNASGFLAHLLSIVKVFAFVIIMRKLGLYEEWAGQGIIPSDFCSYHWDFFSAKYFFCQYPVKPRLILDKSGM